MPGPDTFTTFGTALDTTTEFGRMGFVVRSIMAQQATTTLVIVRAVEDGSVDVQPMVAQVDGAGNAVDHGVIHGLPVWRLQGGNSAVIVEPAVGDIGLAVFASTDISNVKRAKEPTTPGSFRRFDWSDGIYLGGLLNAPASQFVRMDAAGITITVADGQPVTINADTVSMSGDLTVTGSITSGPGSTFDGVAFDTHTHGGVTTGGGTSGPPV